MLGIGEWKEILAQEQAKSYFTWLYPDVADVQQARYTNALTAYEQAYGEKAVAFFSAPGRSEIGGNHTDHQRGKVLAASVTMDMIAVASPRNDTIINFISQGFPTDIVDISDLTVRAKEKNTSAALIRGVCARMQQLGLKIGGFDAYQESNVLKGSGLSSSAALEVLIGTILNGLYNDNRIPSSEIAKIGQYAENIYFGKPCGLMDQMASAVGGVISINFSDAQNPAVEQIPCDFGQLGYEFCIVNAGGSHADLTDEYASIPAEMKQVATAFGKQVLSEVDETEFYKNLSRLRGAVSDRALLRAIHFFADNMAVDLEKNALKNNDIETFRNLLGASGRSSFYALQNCFPSNNVSERSVALALVVSEKLLGGRGASRVHGGGFAGTIQALVPNNMMQQYIAAMEAVFGTGCCYPLSVRPAGGIMIPDSMTQQ